MDPSFHKLDTLPDARPFNKRRHPLPTKIGPYKIESLLNQGGMSLLYLGIHPTTAEPIAVKVLLPKYLRSKEINDRFLHEAKIIEVAHHPNIVKLYDVGEWEKGMYIAMEFIRGISLRQFIKERSFSLKKALEIILQVAEALSHLHSHGVVHRDLKPENILITENGSIKLIDFGIAQLQNEKEENLSQKKMGTPFYMSPEQLENPTQVTYLTDIYALGIIAYELILGQSTHGVIHLELLDPHLKKIVETCLQINPKLRYPKVTDFIRDVTHYMKEEKEEIKPLLPSVSVRSILIPQKQIRAPQLEIGLAVEEGSSSSPYLDVFHLSDNKLVILFAEAESIHINALSLTQTAMLRGMVRMMMQHEKREEKLAPLVQGLNEAIFKDPSLCKFHFSILFLNPDKNILSFISCQSAPLWHLEEGSKKMRELSTPNPLLGQAPNTLLVETSDNWNSGDLVILHSIKTFDNKTDGVFDLITNENKLLSPQHLANKLRIRLLQQSNSSIEESSIVVTIQRIF